MNEYLDTRDVIIEKCIDLFCGKHYVYDFYGKGICVTSWLKPRLDLQFLLRFSSHGCG